MAVGEPADHISRTFGGLNRPDFLEALGDIAYEADILTDRPSPLHFNIAPLRRDDRYRLQNQLRDVARLDETTANLPLSEFQPDETDRPFAAIDAPSGPVTSNEELFFRAQSFRVDDAVDIEQGRYNLSGRQLRPEVIERHQRLINEGVPEGTRQMVFDVETTGTGPNAEVWQLAGRYTDEAGETQSFDFRFGSNQMDFGDFSDIEGNAPRLDTQISPRAGFEEYINASRGDNIQFRRGEEAAQGLRQFLDIAEQQDQWVGHNVAFDIDMVTRQMEETFRAYGTDEDLERVSQFGRQATQRAVDTHLLAAHHLGGIEADELSKSRRLSMDNILMRTSLFEDIETQLGTEYRDEFVTDDVLQRSEGHGGRAAILGRLETGTHFGDVDVWFEEQLKNQFERQQQGEDVLRHLSGEEARGAGNVSPLRGRFRELMGAETAGAVTPVTNLFQEGEDTFRTPVQQQVANMRQISGELPADVSREHVIRASKFGGWVDEATSPTGRSFGELSREMPSGTGMPFEGLSPHERTISGLLGRHTANVQDPGLQQTRGLLGEALGSGMFRGRPNEAGASVYGRGRVAALPTELIQQAEEQGVIGTQYTAAARGEADKTQFARLSTIDYEREGRRVHDIALVGDIGEDDAQNLARFVRELDPESRQRFGLEVDQQLEHVAGTIENYGRSHGIQLGILGEGDPQTNERIVEHMRNIGADVDTGVHKMRVPITPTPVGETGWSTGPALMDVPGREIPEEEMSRSLQAMERTQQQTTQQLQSRRTRNAVQVARQGNANVVQRFMGAMDSLSVNRRNILMGGAAAIGGGLLLKRQQGSDERETYNAPFERMPVEQRSVGRQEWRGVPRQRASPRYLSRHDHTGMPAALHRERTGHHRMGPRNRTQTGR